MISDIPKISKSDYSAEDFDELQHYKLTHEDREGVIVVKHRGEWLTFVPSKLRRAFFWACHFPRHEGVNLMVEKIKGLKFYFPDMANKILSFLSQCSCVLAKESRPPPYQGTKSIFATDVLQILSLDLFEYDRRQYLTLMDISSRLAFVYPLEDKSKDSVTEKYESWISTFDEPLYVLCDNGGEFEGIKTEKLTTPSNHPQSNSILERFHKKMAVMCRVHECTPDAAVKFLRTHQSKLTFFSALKTKFSDATACPFAPQEIVFQKMYLYGDTFQEEVEEK